MRHYAGPSSTSRHLQEWAFTGINIDDFPGFLDSFFYENPVVILIYERVQSHMETTVMSLRYGPNVTVMGSNSIGANGNVTFLPLPGEIGMFFTGLGAYTSEGGQTQRIGLSPDIHVYRTVAGIRDGRDELMDAAIAFLLDKMD